GVGFPVVVGVMGRPVMALVVDRHLDARNLRDALQQPDDGKVAFQEVLQPAELGGARVLRLAKAPEADRLSGDLYLAGLVGPPINLLALLAKAGLVPALVPLPFDVVVVVAGASALLDDPAELGVLIGAVLVLDLLGVCRQTDVHPFGAVPDVYREHDCSRRRDPDAACSDPVQWMDAPRKVNPDLRS